MTSLDEDKYRRPQRRLVGGKLVRVALHHWPWQKTCLLCRAIERSVDANVPLVNVWAKEVFLHLVMTYQLRVVQSGEVVAAIFVLTHVLIWGNEGV